MDCPAQVIFRLSQDEDFLEITEVQLDHKNHILSEGLQKHYSESRKLSPEEEEEVAKLLRMKSDKKLIQQDLRERLGKHVTLKDLSNLKAKLSTGNDRDLIEVVNFLINEKGADVSIRKTGDQFQGLYFSTPDMRRSLSAWPEIVAIDGTYSLLDTNLTLMLMLVEDSNGASEIVAVGLVASEDETTIEWLLLRLRTTMGMMLLQEYDAS